MILDKNQGRRCLQGSLVRLFVASFLVFLFGACASSSTMAPGQESAQGIVAVPGEKARLFGKQPADAVVFNDGVSWLGLSDKPADYAKAKETFAILTQNYPQSTWRQLAETFVHLIGAIQSLQAKGLSERGLADKLKQDNERLKKDLHSLGSKFQADRNSLLQENEQLKKDMELLKQLEVQLDQRGKMLR